MLKAGHHTLKFFLIIMHRPATMHLTKCMLLIMPLSCAFMQKVILALITMDGVKMMFTDSSASMVLMINLSPTKCITHSYPTLAIIGMLGFEQLKTKAQSELSDKFNLKNFHQYILDMGPVQFDILFNNLDAWIKKEK